LPAFGAWSKRLREGPRMSVPIRDEAAAPDAAARHAAVAGPSEFGVGPLGTAAAARRAHPRAAESAFDVCHVGVVLRAVLFVHGVVAIGSVFGAASVDAWLGRLALGSSVSLPAVVLWLLVVCACKGPLVRLAPWLQWAAVTALGAASAAGAALLVLPLYGDPSFDWAGPALAGAAVAAAIFAWLDLRAKARFPADTTARLAELQSRIRPHFLFNTLNTALTLVRLDPARAEGVLEDLAELFRVAISDNAESVTLDEEVALAQRYLDIEQVRFGNRLHVNWELDPEAGGARVPPLLLQPLVENAVRHGVEPSAEGGVIRIRTRVKLGRAVISIANSVPDEASRPGSGMALKNVKERLRLLHDVAAQFETRRDFDVFRVQIVVPL
jgi:two-component system, LytTR family, sensor histidine kinase AlgZ